MRINVSIIERVCWRVVVLLFLLGTQIAGHAQILIGQTAGLTGDGSGRMAEINQGAQIAFDQINLKGGIRGQTIKLLSLDDERDKKKAADNAKTLKEKGAIALLLARSSPIVLALKPDLLKLRLPLIGPATGSFELHEPVHPYIFNVRAPFRSEAASAVRHLVTMGMTSIAVVYQDDAFGKDAAKGALEEISARGLKPTVDMKFERKKRDFSKDMPTLQNAQAILLVGGSEPAVAVIKAVRAAGQVSTIITLSNNSDDSFVKDLGTNARGVIVSQVVPSLTGAGYEVATRFHRLAEKAGIKDPTPGMLEGYLCAEVLIEGLRRIKGPFTSDNLVDALHTFNNVDFGGLKLSYTATDHTGLTFSELSIIDRRGQFLR